MKTIEIDNDVWNEMQSKATPFVDTPNTVLRKMFGLTNTQGGHGLAISRQFSREGRAKGRTPQHTYREPILRSLYNVGGANAVDVVLKDIERELRGILNDVDYHRLNSGRDIRWRNAAAWERAVMVRDGLLKEDSPRGVWELTEKGRKAAQQVS